MTERVNQHAHIICKQLSFSFQVVGVNKEDFDSLMEKHAPEIAKNQEALGKGEKGRDIVCLSERERYEIRKKKNELGQLFYKYSPEIANNQARKKKRGYYVIE